MKPLILSCAIFFAAVAAAYGDWQPIGPVSGNLRAMARAPSNAAIVYAASAISPSQLLKSTDGGASWQRRAYLSDFIYCLAVDPANPDVVYAGSNAKVFKTTDGGTVWTSRPVSGYNIYEIKIDPAAPAVVSAAGAVTISIYNYMAYCRSTDAGASWTTKQLVTDKKSCAYSLDLDPNNSSVITIAGSILDSLKSPYLFRSTDGGANFVSLGAGLPPCSTAWALAYHPTNASIIYLGTTAGILRSTDGGSAWSVVGAYPHIYDLETCAAAAGLVFAGSDTAVYKSTDSGATWVGVSNGLEGKSFFDVRANQADPNDINAANNYGFFKTSNAGATWSAANTGINAAAVLNFTAAPSQPAVLYSEVEDVGVFKTTNQGGQWVLLPEFLSCGSLCGLAVHNGDPNTVLGLEGNG